MPKRAAKRRAKAVTKKKRKYTRRAKPKPTGSGPEAQAEGRDSRRGRAPRVARKITTEEANAKLGAENPQAAELGGLEEALQAFGEPESKGAQHEAPSSVPSYAGMVDLAEMAVSTSAFLASIERDIPQDELERLQRLTPSERSVLLILAPSASPAFEQLAKRIPLVGALSFAIITAVLAMGRIRSVQRLAKPIPKMRPVPKAQQERDEAKQEENTKPAYRSGISDEEWAQHCAVWGPAATAIPVGTQPVEAGLPDRFQPKGSA